ncbi:hypothetical protein ABZ646_22450, partial [Streptomyces sp. NPDC007162]|uniref:hypothetical protein n=1 Tax=Streptomyces sp. NPDC007162 TaxID=3156917 RepID=UPI0033C1FA1C
HLPFGAMGSSVTLSQLDTGPMIRAVRELFATGYAATLSRRVKRGAPCGPQVTVTEPVRAARTVTRVTPWLSVAAEVTRASIGLLLRGCGQAPWARGLRTTVTVVPDRTHRVWTEGSPGPWAVVVEPATHPADAEDVP